MTALPAGSERDKLVTIDDRPPVLVVRDLTVEFCSRHGDVQALSKASFDIPAGSALGLVGESGSGKSTTALAILRLLGANGAIKSGTIGLNGRDLVALSEREMRNVRGREVAMVFQDALTSLTPSRTVGDQIAETIVRHKRLSERAAWADAVDLLRLVGVTEPALRARRYPHEFSGGMRQRVGIALAIACRPPLIILDEPTTALDVTIQAQILDLLRDLRRDLGLALLFITHDLAVIAQVCDAVCVLYAGRVVESGSVGSVFSAPLHPYTKGLLACLPPDRPENTPSRRLESIPGRMPTLHESPRGCVFQGRCPFVEETCRAEPQILQAGTLEHAVACWKAERLQDTPWVSSEPETTAPQAGEPRADLVATDVSKAYPVSGFWRSFRLERTSRLQIRVAHERQYVQALDDASLRIASGETFGLVGESGCGKSTLGRALVGLVHLDEGEVRLAGKQLGGETRNARRARGRAIQIIFQNLDASLNPRWRVGEIVGRPLILYGSCPRRDVPQRIVELLESVQLSARHARRFPHEMSGGEKQRIGIARALAAEPDIIVCDEPISALDASVRASVLNLLGDLRDRLGVGYLFIAHDLAVVRQVADRVGVMYLGRICESGTTKQVFSPPFHPYTWALLSAIPRIEASTRPQRWVRLDRDVIPSKRGAQQRVGCLFSDRCPLRIGPICDTVAPPELDRGHGHRIACHHSNLVLAQLDPAEPDGRPSPA